MKAQVVEIVRAMCCDREFFLERKPKLLIVTLMAAALFAQQRTTTKRILPGAGKPECAPGAICFSGEVREGQEFRRHLNAALDFVVTLPGGIDILSRHADASCKRSAWVANPPLRAHHDTEIDAAYDWTAEQEVRISPREFWFATNCADFRRLYDLSQTDVEKYVANRNLLGVGFGVRRQAVRYTHSSCDIQQSSA